MALGLTALVFALEILHWGYTKSGWLFTSGFVLHGWLLVAMNIFFYGYLCWVGFWLVRGTAGIERLFIMGWFAGLLLSPLRMLGPQWAVAIKHVGAVGLAVAFLAGLSLLLNAPDVANGNGRTDAMSALTGRKSSSRR